MLPAITRDNRGRAILLGYLAFSVLYLAAGKLHIGQPEFLAPSALDEAIPFIDWTIGVYLSQFALLFLALWLFDDSPARSRTFYGMMLATMIVAPVFIFWPTEIPRQPVTGEDIMARLWRALYFIDPATNNLPSLHVALAGLAAIRFAWAGGFWRWLGPSWAVMIAVSTLTTKQHILVDVLGGILLAAASYYLVRRFLGATIQ